MHGLELHLNNFKDDFLNISIFFTLRFQIYKYCLIITNHTSIESIFIQLQMKIKSQFQKYLYLLLIYGPCYIYEMSTNKNLKFNICSLIQLCLGDVKG